MLRFRAFVTLALVILCVYALAPAERKQRWLDKMREFGKALTISIVIYWIYMLILYFYK